MTAPLLAVVLGTVVSMLGLNAVGMLVWVVVEHFLKGDV